MSERNPGGPFESSELALLDSMSRFYEERSILLGMVTHVTTQESVGGEYLANLFTQVHKQGKVFTDLSLVMFDASFPVSSSFANSSIAERLLWDDNRRGDAFDALAGTKYYQKLSPKKATMLISKAVSESHDRESFGECLHAMYTDKLYLSVKRVIEKTKNPTSPILDMRNGLMVDLDKLKDKAKLATIAGGGVALGGLIVQGLFKRQR